jgi:hypothetical protein
MTDANQNPPSEREWTIEEREEFFTSRDAITGLPWNVMPGRTGIVITNIVPPEQGWPIAAHCCHCKKTVIVLNLYAAKPEKSDYWLLKGTCLDEELHWKHNMYPQFDYPWPSRMGPRPEEWWEEAYNNYWNRTGVPK